MSQIWNNLTNTEIPFCCIGSVKTVDHLSCNISSKRRSVSSPDETLRRELKIRRAAEYFWRKFEVFHLVWWWNTVFNASYYYSTKMILKGEINEAKMSSFFFPNTGRTGACYCKMLLRSFPTYKHPSPSSYSPNLIVHKKVPPIITSHSTPLKM